MHRYLHSPFLLLILSAGLAQAATHSLDMQPAAKGESIAYDMNTKGQVAGVVIDNAGNQQAVFFEHGQLIQIGTLGGKDSEARHINSEGDIIGSANKSDGSWRAFLYNRSSGMHEIGTLGGTNSHGEALNNLGEAVGFADTVNGDWHAFLYHSSGSLTDLGTLGGKISYASGMNNKGQVVGAATLANGYRHAFLYDPVHGMVDLGTLGGRSSTATSINDSGVIVGAAETAQHQWHAFMYSAQGMVDLGARIGQGDSFATGINSAGHVVGTVNVGESRLSFVWRDNHMTLHHGGTKGLYLTNSINDGEQVIGATYDRGLNAATMASSSLPFVDHGGSKLFDLIVLVLLLAGVAVIYHRRYRGILLNAYDDVQGSHVKI